jgi:hypothetical protein
MRREYNKAHIVRKVPNLSFAIIAFRKLNSRAKNTEDWNTNQKNVPMRPDRNRTAR